MTATHDHATASAFEPGPSTTYDLIVLAGDRIVFHDFFDTPEQRLGACVRVLTCADVLARVPARAVYYFADEHQHRGTPADDALNKIAKLARQHAVHVFMSTTEKRVVVPPVPGASTLYTVQTAYDPSATAATFTEHFASREARHDSLLHRADAFFARPDSLPDLAVENDERLAGMISLFIAPGTVRLSESVWNEDHGCFEVGGVLDTDVLVEDRAAALRRREEERLECLEYLRGRIA